eukprot:gnl/MRDRNA2_/MRDRNA2_28817_c0_seq2.p1 gnl/MRDRNA2_/MRDRNA2_28817_c0~~gnl/MRDRNA2_/MRDRNA2_28817_c0_seq2.p1  ORF type:complete len:399 (+),score=96.17 gnl/MRDRNA2_/MRDRNA2_28817_c0_seq2:90-1286(+)
MAPIEVGDALQNAAIAIKRAHGSSDDVDAVTTFPLIIKNTFFDFEEKEADQVGPKSLSCPPEVFYPSSFSSFPCTNDAFAGSSLSDALAGSSELNLNDLAAAARLFSESNVTREFMELAGHVGARVARPMPPPPLSEPELPELDEPEAPVWTPKVGSPQHRRPSPPPLSYPETPLSSEQTLGHLPQWTPQVGGPGSSASMPPLSPPLPGGYAYNLQSQRATGMSFYRVHHGAGIELRKGPSFAAPKTDVTLYCNEIFAVSEEIPASDGRIYLLLADGRGWAFDDAALHPHCPSVARGQWVPVPPAAMTSAVSPASTVWEPMEEPMSDLNTKKRRRRKRGGVKRNKNKKKSMAQCHLESAADAETEVPSSDDIEEREEDDSPSEKGECRLGSCAGHSLW